MTYIHNISPIMLEVFGIKLYWYGFMYAISFVIIDYLIVSASKNKNIGLELPAAEKLTIVILLFAIIGGRLGYVIFYDLSYFASNIQKIFYLWEGGMSFHGGLIGGVIGSVYLTGKKAPTIIKRSMLEQIKPGTVLVDISIDQGGCFETSKPTTHQDPTFLIDDILHYCVSNMPGAVPLTASESLNSVSLSYVQKLANNDLNLLLNEQDFKSGLNIMAGEFKHPSLIDII